MPRISVIIPAGSEAGHLEKLIASLRAQSYTDFEIIVSVNGARDETADIARRLADTVIETPERIGPSGARNAGARNARGDILVFIDADSVVSPNTLSEIARRWRPRVYGSIWARPGTEDIRAYLYIGAQNLMRQLRLYTGAPAGVIFCSRELFEKIGGFDSNRRIGEYQDFIERLVQHGARFKLLNKASTLVSMRRQEQDGYLATILFWVKWRFASPTKKATLGKSYWK